MTTIGITYKGEIVVDGLDARGRICENLLNEQGFPYEIEIPPGAEPVVTANPATLITINGATLNATVVWDGVSGGLITERGFEWGETLGYGETWHEDGAWASGMSYSHAISGLDSSTLYHFRAWITYVP